MATDPVSTLDVREIDGKPCDDVTAALESLEAGDRFRLVAPFEPEPLYDRIEERGLTYESDQPEEGLWHVLIEHP